MVVDVAVVVATIPGREKDLERALESVAAQTVAPAQVIVQTDAERRGAAQTRNLALDRVRSGWVAFLDDDDVLYPHHIEQLYSNVHRRFADLAYPWFDVEVHGVVDNGRDPLAARWDGRLQNPYGKRFGAEQRTYLMNTANFIPITHLSRTSLVKHVGGFPVPGTPEWPYADCEDWGLLKRLLHAGAVFTHEPTRSWRWRMHGKNTSGRGVQQESNSVK